MVSVDSMQWFGVVIVAGDRRYLRTSSCVGSAYRTGELMDSGCGTRESKLLFICEHVSYR